MGATRYLREQVFDEAMIPAEDEQAELDTSPCDGNARLSALEAIADSYPIQDALETCSCSDCALKHAGKLIEAMRGRAGEGFNDDESLAAAWLDRSLLQENDLEQHLNEAGFELIAAPGDVLDALPENGDLVIERALAEGDLGQVSVVVRQAIQGGNSLVSRPVPLSRRYPIRKSQARHLRLRRNGQRYRMPRNAMIVRARYGHGESMDNDSFAEQVLHQCRAGEGPPAAVPDPAGRGLHPLVYRGASHLRSRNPTVGDAQQLLNKFLQGLSAGTYHCHAGADLQAIRRIRASLTQDPLVVDCRFGPNTEKATRMFQHCVFPGRPSEWDGKIGPRTWTELERLRTPSVIPVPPTPTPPAPPPVPVEINDLLQRIREVLEQITEYVPERLRPYLSCSGVVVPTRARFLTSAEQTEARTMYGSSLDFTRIVITDGLGCGGRPFTVAVQTAGHWWVAMNMGSLASAATHPASDTLIHELAHAWQSQHHGSDKTAFMVNSVINQAGASALSAIGIDASAYAYIPGKTFAEYGAEQIAEQIEDSYQGSGSPTPSVVAHVSSVAAHAADAANENSLTVFTGFERRSTPGVVWP